MCRGEELALAGECLCSSVDSSANFFDSMIREPMGDEQCFSKYCVGEQATRSQLRAKPPPGESSATQKEVLQLLSGHHVSKLFEAESRAVLLLHSLAVPRIYRLMLLFRLLTFSCVLSQTFWSRLSCFRFPKLTFDMALASAMDRRTSAEHRRLSFESDESTAAGSDLLDDFSTFKNVPLTSSVAAQTLFTRFDRRPFFTRPICSSQLLSMSSRTLLRCLVPSFLHDRLIKQPVLCANARRAGTTTKIRTLDGLRGLACLFVFNEHYTYNFSKSFLYGYGVEDHRTIIQYPGIRLFFSGFSMVAVFFVISGYVLSYKPLQQMRTKKAGELQKTITSSVFRRAFRLFLPPIIATLICGLLVYLGAFNAGKTVWETDGNYLHLHEPTPPEHPGFFNQMRDAAKCSTWILNIWNWNDDMISVGDYDLHTWTMPVEFRCSMALFLMLVATAGLRQNIRLLANATFITFCVVSDWKHVTLFLAGMLIAELDMIRQDTSSALLPISRRLSSRCTNKASSTAWLLLFFLGTYLASVPVSGCDSTPGFVTLCSWVPSTVTDKGWFIRSIGAVSITWSAINSESLKSLFTNRFSLYLGQISFALYLVHGNVLKSLQYASMPWIYSVTGIVDPDIASTHSMVAAWLIGLLGILPVTFWLSDLFWRWVDMPCVRFVRWLEGKLSDELGEEEMIEWKARW